DIYIQSFPVLGRKVRVSTSGGRRPRWSRDGNEIFFVAPDQSLMVAAVSRAGSTLEVGAVSRLPGVRLDVASVLRNSAYDVAADGQRVLLVTSEGVTAPVPLTVVLNWAAALKK